ncbi:unnamed protein product [Polarella glacialis]|uniref:Calmodulin-lysine N-methyltransferase n=1 Tax=Polarella glacialis TaxID=89957 RepID=A0A813DSK0_POLGL|nr:unnamed protein product [Polarella glacialis]
MAHLLRLLKAKERPLPTRGLGDKCGWETENVKGPRLEQDFCCETDGEASGSSTTLEAALNLRIVGSEDNELRILEDSQGIWANGNGATIWDSALLLADFLRHQPALGRLPGSGLRALELGAGLGLVGLTLAKLGAQVVATERALALPLLRRNVAENSLDDAVRVEELFWGSKHMPTWVYDSAPFDIVVGSDLIWPGNADCIVDLVETLSVVVGPATSCWLAYEPRASATDEALLASLRAAHFRVRRLQGQELPADAPEDLWILHLEAEPK